MKEVYIYCDICSCPIKGEINYLMSFKESETDKVFYDKDKRYTKEICESCSQLVSDIFKLKKTKIKEITTKIEYTYKLKTRQPKRTRKKGGKNGRKNS